VLPVPIVASVGRRTVGRSRRRSCIGAAAVVQPLLGLSASHLCRWAPPVYSPTG
jgi:hypothetical protein